MKLSGQKLREMVKEELHEVLSEAYMGEPEIGDIVQVKGDDKFGEITHTDDTGEKYWVSYHGEPSNRGLFFHPGDLEVVYDNRYNEWTSSVRPEHKRAYSDKYLRDK